MVQVDAFYLKVATIKRLILMVQKYFHLNVEETKQMIYLIIL